MARILTDNSRENNPMWKGDKATYKAFHLRVSAARGKPKKCEVCDTTDPTKRYEWASLTKNYADVMDYRRMCYNCHFKFDGRDKKLVDRNIARKKPKIPKEYPTLTCAHPRCSNKFVKKHFRKRYCCHRCMILDWCKNDYDKHRKKPTRRVCALRGCSVVFESARKRKKFCCKDHQIKGWYITRRQV